jgi:hypothetical protein
MPEEQKIPSFDEVMGNDKTSSKIPSFDEVMGTNPLDKKEKEPVISFEKQMLGGIGKDEWSGSAGSIKPTSMQLMEKEAKGAKAKTDATRKETPIIGDVKETNKALDNTIAKWAKQNNVDVDNPKAKAQRKKYEQGLGGEYAVRLDDYGEPQLAHNADGITSVLSAWSSSNNLIDESKRVKKMSNKEGINYLKDLEKNQQIIPEIPRGYFGQIGQFLGEQGRMVTTSSAGSLAAKGLASVLAPETGGLSLALIGIAGGATALAPDIMAQNYISDLQKYWQKAKEENEDISDEDAYAKAKSQALTSEKIGIGEAVGYELGSTIVGKLFPKAVTGSGVKSAISKYITEATPGLIAAETVTMGSSVAKDLSAKQKGFDISNKEMLDNALDKGNETLKFVGAMSILHGAVNNAVKIPKYLKAQLLNHVSDATPGVPEQFLNNLAKNGVADPKDVEKTKTAISSFQKAKETLSSLNIDDEATSGALSGKQEKKLKIQAEIDDLKKKNVSIGIEDKENEIKKIDYDMKNIYQTGNVFENEYDNEVPSPSQKLEVKPTEEVKSVKLIDLPDRAFAVGMPVEKFEDLKSKIQKEGFTLPIIIDKESGNVLDGQSRLSVAQDLGIEDVPYIYMDNPTRTDLNEKIKELEKQYIPTQEVKPTEVKEEFKPTEEEIKISETAAPEQRAEALKQTKESYGTQPSTKGVGEPTAPISEDVLSKPVKDIVKSAEPAEQSALDKFRTERYKSEDEFRAEYNKPASEGGHRSELGETKEEFLLRKFCE